MRARNDEGDGGWSDSGTGSTGAPGNHNPEFADATLTRSIAENTAADVNIGTAIPAATDADDDELKYTMEGTDEGSFNFNESTLHLTTKAGVTYDYEKKPSYSVTIKVEDDYDGDDTVDVTINLTDVDEPPSAPTAPSVQATSGSTTSLDVSWTAPGNDGKPEIVDYDLRYRVAGTEGWIAGAQNVETTSAVIAGLAASTDYQVQVSARNDEGDGDWSASGAGSTSTPGNNPPDFSDTTLTREIAENSVADVNVGAVIPEATDADSDTLTYSMEGTDEASFNFNQTTRQITTKSGVTYDRETKNSYSVTIRVSDGTDSDTVAVTINLTNVIELPSAPTGLTVSPTLGVGGSLDASWTAPTNTDKPTITGYKLQYATVSSGPWSNGPQNVTGASSTITTGLTEDTLYYVRVLASNGDGDGAWSGTDDATTKIATTSANCPAPTLTGRAQIWSATVSVGRGRISNIVTYHGFNSVTQHDVFGALSDTGFQIGTNSYTVLSLASIPIEDHAVFFGLDRHVTDTEKAELTLHVCGSDFALSSGVESDNFGFEAYQWANTVDWSTFATRNVYLSVPSDNSAPTASNGSVTTDEDTAHTFEADDFSFSDTDSGDTLSGVEVVTLPSDGTLTLDGTDVTLNQDVTESDIDDDKLVFTPAANANGTGYASFTFKVSDGTDKSSDAYTMTVNVTAVNDAATGLPTISGTARVGETLTAATTGIGDVDGLTGVSYTYQWVRVDSGTDSDIASATSSTYTLVDDDLGNTVKVKVSFTDDGGTGEELTSAETATIMAGSTNNAPVFSDATLTRSVAENSAANVSVGAVIPEATDADVGATLEYSMEGTDAASFNFDVSTRQITTRDGVTYDRETKDSYSVTIKVSDGTLSDTVAVTINVTNVIELPSAPTGLTVSPTLGVGGSLDASWTAPTNTDKPTITGYKLQYATSSSGPWNNGPQNVTGTSSTITTGLAENTLYYVRVLAFNTDGDGAWSSTDSATTRIATTTTNCPAPTLTGRAQIWSATASLGTGRVNNGLVPYIGFNTVTPHDVFGALSDTSFEVGTNSYTVRTLATLPTISDALFLSLDRHVTDTEKAELTLHVCDDAFALSSAIQVDDAGFKAYQWAYGVDWSDYATREAYLSVPSDNSAPTAANGSVTTDEDTAHTFAAAEFNFADTDSGDTLALVEVVTLPSDGALTLDGTDVTLNQDVTESDIDDDKLVFTPAANASGTGYASFTFKVGDGTHKSALAYTMTVNVTAVNDAATGAPTIGGTARVGQTLTAATTGIGDVDGLTGVSYTYQWVRVDSGTDTDISGATASTYTLADADGGNTVKVEVSFTDDGGSSEELTSAATGVVAANTPPTASNGSVTTDEDTAHTFEADNFNFSDTDSGDTLSLVEVVTLPLAGMLTLDGTAVTTTQDVTKSNIDDDKLVFTPAANANGTGYASFTFKVSDGGDKSDSAYTMTVNVTAMNDAATGLPTISGTARVGATLTAATTDIADADGLPASFSYQWVRVDSGTDTGISGATSSTYTLVGDDEGNTVKVEVSFTDDAGNSEGPLTSAATGVVAPPVNTAPDFDVETATRSVAENTPADTAIGAAFPAASDGAGQRPRAGDARRRSLRGMGRGRFATVPSAQ